MLDVFWLGGPSLEAVVSQYHALTGTPLLPPAWALGFHQSRWGYGSTEALEATVRAYAAAAIPLDTIWSDIDHMDGFRIFTLDQRAYAAPRMRAFLRRLRASGRRWVPIVDPGVKIDAGYPAYDEGVKGGLFLKGVDGRPYVGRVRCAVLCMLPCCHLLSDITAARTFIRQQSAPLGLALSSTDCRHGVSFV